LYAVAEKLQSLDYEKVDTILQTLSAKSQKENFEEEKILPKVSIKPQHAEYKEDEILRTLSAKSRNEEIEELNQ